MRELRKDEELQRVLQESSNVAVLGAHPDPQRPSHYVPDYLARHGYVIWPVNPTRVGQELWGKQVQPRLGDLAAAIDVVDVFRRSELVEEHVDEILAMEPLPRVVWLQAGIRNDSAAERLMQAGIEVVQDHCMMAEHKRLCRQGGC